MSINNYLNSVGYYAREDREFEYLREVLFLETKSMDNYYSFVDDMLDTYLNYKGLTTPFNAKKRAMTETTYKIVRYQQENSLEERLQE